MGNMGPAAGQITFLVIHACTQSFVHFGEFTRQVNH